MYMAYRYQQSLSRCIAWQEVCVQRTGRNEGRKGDIIPRGAESLWGRQITAGSVEWLRGAPKSPNNVTNAFFSTVHLLPKDLRFEHGAAKLASCPGRHLTSLRTLFNSHKQAKRHEMNLWRFVAMLLLWSTDQQQNNPLTTFAPCLKGGEGTRMECKLIAARIKYHLIGIKLLISGFLENFRSFNLNFQRGPNAHFALPADASHRSYVKRKMLMPVSIRCCLRQFWSSETTSRG